MKNIKFLTIAVILVAGSTWTNPAVRNTSVPSQWEYKIVYTGSEDDLNRLGSQGWEVSTAYVGLTNGTGSTPYLVLKRAKRR